ncbi:peptidoglycan recognition protein family protein [Nonomuraea sp. SBT364]|uniref:peptidoglycan recognition protein family protein n=1 Tax=Nonomuraea sp. SBT364 TaxID=1580530 RepID=UPI00069D7C1B|nr:peptidoglycan recognition family protein [Nonomuraea sp. SBT364]
MLLWAVVAATVLVAPGRPDVRQADFASAARTYGVPESVLLGVSYLQSRWDAHGGAPSTAGGYGPMHLLDPAAAPPGPGHTHADRRGDTARPRPPMNAGQESPGAATYGGPTVAEAGRLTGLSAERLRSDPAANIRGGAALLASYQERPSADPAGWYDAVARYAGSREFADEVLSVMRAGTERRTDDGSTVRLPATAGLPGPAPLRRAKGAAECPHTLACEWLPAAYARTGKGDHGNHDRLDRPRRVDYIVIHDTEGTYDGIASLVRNPKYVSWHYTIRSRDGHVAQHVHNKDIAWHAGNWDVNTRSIGIEHEGYLAKGGTWYTEAMYRASAKLVRYLADKHDIPLDRQHILGHDNVPGTSAATLPQMHEDPGPYWDWAHYFDLLGEPFDRPAYEQAGYGRGPESVLVLPSYDEHRPRFTGCETAKPAKRCPPHGASTLWLRTEPREDAPLVDDAGKRPGKPSTYSVYDHSARASAGQRFGVAEQRGDWTAIWYLGRRAWFHNPPARPTAVAARGPLVTPVRPGVKVYGRAFPEKRAYAGTRAPFQRHAPLPYTLAPGQSYALGQTLAGAYHSARSFDPARHVTVKGNLRYHQIQLGHRVAFVRAEDVRVIR